jgi:hypothetical protein
MTSPLCLLDGHQFALVAGVGRFSGRSFSICAQCGSFEHLADFNEHNAAGHAEMTRQPEKGGKDGVHR